MLKLVWYCVALFIQATCCGSSIAEGFAATSVIAAPSLVVTSEVNFSIVIKSYSADSNYLKGFLVKYPDGNDQNLFAVSDVAPSVISPSRGETRIKNFAFDFNVDGLGTDIAQTNAAKQIWRDRHVLGSDTMIGSSKSPNGKQIALSVRNENTYEDSILIVDEENYKVVRRLSFIKRAVEDFCWSPDSSMLAVVVSKSHMAISPIALLLAFSGHPASYRDFSIGVLLISSDKWIESKPIAQDILSGVSYMRCNSEL
jgi:hypothetical protein